MEKSLSTCMKVFRQEQSKTGTSVTTELFIHLAMEVNATRKRENVLKCF